MTELHLHVHGMDCADEAALVRRALDSLPGLSRLEFDLINGLVSVTFDEDRTTAAAIATAIHRTGLPAHAVIVADMHGEVPHDHVHGDHSSLLTGIAVALFAIGWTIDAIAADEFAEVFVGHSHDPKARVAYGLAAAIALAPMWSRAIAAVRHLRLDMHALVCLTVIGAAIIGEWSEGAAVAVLFAIAHRMEAWSLERARTEISALVGRGPELIAQGMQRSAEVERWIERFAGIYTPVVTLAAVVLAIVPPVIDGRWDVWFYRALVFLVLACPCALVISTPVTMVAALTSAARQGVLVKGAATLERAAAVDTPTRQGFSAAGLTVAGAPDASEFPSVDVLMTANADRGMEFLVHHARRALGVVRQNVAIALLTKVAFLASAPFGFAPLWMAVLADTGATVIVTLNGLRMLRP